MSSAERSWDVLVIGAGPAGAMAAHSVAAMGRSVLLVDRCAFPRPKACGCCINRAALGLLSAAGLHDVPAQLGATELREFRVVAGGRACSIPVPGGAALSREALDMALLDRAVDSGARFLPETTAVVAAEDVGGRWVDLAQPSGRRAVHARVILVADGLAGGALRNEPACRADTWPSSRVGLSAILEESPAWCRPGVITMACAAAGYVGLVRLEDQRVNVAAALAPEWIRSCGGAGPAVAALLTRAGVGAEGALGQVVWRGTPALRRRRRRVAAPRVLVLGDSAGYVEPFTGEGIAWALASGAAVAPLAVAGVEHWTSDVMAQWEQRYQRLIARRQGLCRLVSKAVRCPALTTAGIRLLSWFPGLAAPIVRALNTW